AELQGYLGFDWPDGQKVTYEKFVDGADFATHQNCGAPADGCTLGTMVESPLGLDPHELVHSYLRWTGFPPTVIREGVAVALACQSSLFAQRPTQTWDQLASAGYSADDAVYYAGTWLVGYLLDVYGPRSFLTLYRTLSSTPDAATMDAAFRTIYGVSLSAIWTAALGESQPRNVCIWQCSRPPLALDGVPVETAGVCGVEGAFPFTLASESTISLATTGPGFSVEPCGQVPLPNNSVNSGLGLYDLPAGSYFVDVSPTAGTLTGRSDVSGALTPTCAAATDVAALGAGNVFAVMPSTKPSWFLPLPPPPIAGGQPLTPVVGSLFGTALICASCDPASCVSSLQAGQVLNIATDPSHPFVEGFLNWISP
ncbi:MAG TPA: hypothetical protein VLA79_04675, partial [Polyangia bacterium]|nr:hypothetical protein [Polyangia bacterium]